MSTFVSLAQIITVVIIAISAAIIYLILYIIISGMIISKKQDLGILKALGFVTNNLIIQISTSFIPSSIIGAMMGVIVSKLFLGEMFKLLFNGLGIYKISFVYPIIPLLLVRIINGFKCIYYCISFV